MVEMKKFLIYYGIPILFLIPFIYFGNLLLWYGGQETPMKGGSPAIPAVPATASSPAIPAVPEVLPKPVPIIIPTWLVVTTYTFGILFFGITFILQVLCNWPSHKPTKVKPSWVLGESTALHTPQTSYGAT